MSIKSCLKERALTTAIFSNCRVKRMTLVIWNGQEAAAREAGLRLRQEMEKTGLGAAVEYLSFDQDTDPAGVFRGFLQDCRRKIQEGELPENVGYYILLLSDQSDLLSSLRKEFVPGMNLDWVRFHPAPVSPEEASLISERCRRIWVLPDVYSRELLVLALQGAYGRVLLSPPHEPARAVRPFMLCLREYDVIAEKLAIRYEAQLDRKMQTTEYTDDQLWDWFGLEKEVQEILKDCPRTEWLPLTGYEGFRRRMENKAAHADRGGFLQRVLHRREAPGNAAAMTIEQLLGQLYSTEQDLPMPEWLRKQLKEKELPRMCQAYMRNRETNTREELARYFSLEDVHSAELAGRLEDFAREKKKAVQQREDRIRQELGKSVSVTSADPDGIDELLSDYFSWWRRYIRECADEIYLGCLAGFVRDQADDCRREMERLQKARTILENCRIGFWEPVSADEAGEAPAVSNIDELESFIVRDNSSAQYHFGQVDELIRRADNAYVDSADYQSSEENKPRFLLLYNENLHDPDQLPLQTPHFAWEKVPESYIPRSMIWELRMYRVREETASKGAEYGFTGE